MAEKIPDWLELTPGEMVLKSSFANRTEGPIAAGGRLVLTDRRLVHGTHRAEKALSGTQNWELALPDVAAADLAARTLNPFDGGLRKRLRVRTAQGAEILFVVNGAAAWAAAVGAAAD